MRAKYKFSFICFVSPQFESPQFVPYFTNIGPQEVPTLPGLKQNRCINTSRDYRLRKLILIQALYLHTISWQTYKYPIRVLFLPFEVRNPKKGPVQKKNLIRSIFPIDRSKINKKIPGKIERSFPRVRIHNDFERCYNCMNRYFVI